MQLMEPTNLCIVQTLQKVQDNKYDSIIASRNTSRFSIPMARMELLKQEILWLQSHIAHLRRSYM